MVNLEGKIGVFVMRWRGLSMNFDILFWSRENPRGRGSSKEKFNYGDFLQMVMIVIGIEKSGR